jgi:hypothetical protein
VLHPPTQARDTIGCRRSRYKGDRDGIPLFSKVSDWLRTSEVGNLVVKMDAVSLV